MLKKGESLRLTKSQNSFEPSMGFEVQITDEAFEDLDAIVGFIKGEASIDIARKWFTSILNTIETLKEMPGRCSLAPESTEIQDEIRVLLHGRRKGTYKIYFKIVQATFPNVLVQVFHVRHSARKPLTRHELDELMDDQEEWCACPSCKAADVEMESP